MATEEYPESFAVEDEELVNNPAKRCPCLLVLDTSGSMEGDPIGELNEGVAQFVRELKSHEIAAASVELGMISFGSVVHERVDFTLAEDVEVPPLAASGITCMGEAVTLAIERLRERRQEYQAARVSSFVPWLVLI